MEHARVGTEHLLLGLLCERDGPAAAVLHNAGATVEAARHMVAEVAGSTDVVPGVELRLQFTARAQRALDRAARFSRHERMPEVDAEHLLLGILDVEGLACQVLRRLGVDVARLRDGLAVARTGAPVTAPEPIPVATVSPRCPTCRASLDDTLTTRIVHARADTGAARPVVVVYCAECLSAVGIVGP